MLFERDIRSRLVAAPKRSSIGHRRWKGTQRDLFGGARFSSDGDRYLASCLGHGAAGCQRKIPDHRLARGGSRKDRTACGLLLSGPEFQLLAALPGGANPKDAQAERMGNLRDLFDGSI